MEKPSPESPPARRKLRITRRQVLAAGGLVAAAGAVAGGLRVASWWDRQPGEGFEILSDDEAAIVDAIAEAMFPPGGTPALSGKDAGIAAWFDVVLAHTPQPTPNLIRTLMHALDDQARLTRGRGFANLPLQVRTARLHGWLRSSNHNVRGAIGSLVLFVSMGYCGHPDVKEACGWVWPCGFER